MGTQPRRLPSQWPSYPHLQTAPGERRTSVQNEQGDDPELLSRGSPSQTLSAQLRSPRRGGPQAAAPTSAAARGSPPRAQEPTWRKGGAGGSATASAETRPSGQLRDHARPPPPSQEAAGRPRPRGQVCFASSAPAPPPLPLLADVGCFLSIETDTTLSGLASPRQGRGAAQPRGSSELA